MRYTTKMDIISDLEDAREKNDFEFLCAIVERILNLLDNTDDQVESLQQKVYGE